MSYFDDNENRIIYGAQSCRRHTPRKEKTMAKAAKKETIQETPAADVVTDLVVIEGKKPSEIFVADEITAVLEQCRQLKESFVYPDLTTKAGQDAVKSFAFRFTKFKTKVDDIGKDYVALLKDEPKRIDAERKRLRDTLDAMAAEIRQPVTEIEVKEKARMDAHNQALTDLGNLPIFGVPHPTAAMVQERLDKLATLKARDFEENHEVATLAIDAAQTSLDSAYANAVQYEKDQAELKRLRDEKAAQDEKDRLERIRQEGIEEGKRQAAAAPAPAPAQTTAAPAAQAPQAAPVPTTPAPAAKPPRSAEDEQKAAIHREILASLTSFGATEAGAKNLITAIAQGKIRHVYINYTGTAEA